MNIVTLTLIDPVGVCLRINTRATCREREQGGVDNGINIEIGGGGVGYNLCFHDGLQTYLWTIITF